MNWHSGMDTRHPYLHDGAASERLLPVTRFIKTYYAWCGTVASPFVRMGSALERLAAVDPWRKNMQTPDHLLDRHWRQQWLRCEPRSCAVSSSPGTRCGQLRFLHRNNLGDPAFQRPSTDHGVDRIHQRGNLASASSFY